MTTKHPDKYKTQSQKCDRRHKSYLIFILLFSLLFIFTRVLDGVLYHEIGIGDAIYMFLSQGRYFIVIGITFILYYLINRKKDDLPSFRNTKAMFDLIAKYMLPASLGMDIGFILYNFYVQNQNIQTAVTQFLSNGKLSIILIILAIILYFINKRKK